jgi:predicted HD phosphohydrolase
MSEMTQKLISEMVKVFGDDVNRINHAMAVLWHAQRIRAAEGGDELVVDAAAILHDIGIHQAQKKYNSAAGKYQEIEGPPIAAAILEKLDIGGEKAEHICCIVGNHHSARDIDSIEFSCIWDADWIVNIPEECGNMDKEKLASFIDRIFRTKTGRETAKTIHAGNYQVQKSERDDQ